MDTTSNIELRLEGLKIFPNPTSGLLNVELESKEQIETVSIFDITGKQVMVAHSNEVNISES